MQSTFSTMYGVKQCSTAISRSLNLGIQFLPNHILSCGVPDSLSALEGCLYWLPCRETLSCFYSKSHDANKSWRGCIGAYWKGLQIDNLPLLGSVISAFKILLLNANAIENTATQPTMLGILFLVATQVLTTPYILTPFITFGKPFMVVGLFSQ